MLKLSGLVKATPFLFTELDGSEHELEVREFTVSDIKKLMDLQKPAVTNVDMSVLEQSEIIVGSRIVCAVKVKATGEHYWDKVEDLTSVGYPNGLLDALYPIVNELNPMDVRTTDEKKSNS